MRFKIFTASLIILVSINYVYSTDLIIDENVTLKEGIYKDLYEFKHNNPSIGLDFEIKSNDNGYGFLNLTGKVTYYYFVIDKKLGKELGEVFGFCDGKDVFINSNNNANLAKSSFLKLENIGRYSYYKNIYYSTVYNGTSTSSTSQLGENVIDFNDGKKIRLTNKTLRNLIQSDNKLLEEFNSTKSKSDYYKDFILKYSDSHRDEVLNLDFSANIKDLIYFDEKIDTSFDSYYERVKNYEAAPKINAIKEDVWNYGNKNPKEIGLKCKHDMGGNPDYYYKIGTWRFFYKTGELKEIVNFDFRERKNGLYRKYDYSGQVIEEKNFIEGQEQF